MVARGLRCAADNLTVLLLLRLVYVLLLLPLLLLTFWRCDVELLAVTVLPTAGAVDSSRNW